MLKKRVIYLILIVCWMLTIFYFSSQNADDSQSTSDVFTDKIVGILNISNESTADSVRNIVSFIVRKSAHFIIYFVGGFVIYGFMKTFDISTKNVLYYSILFGCFYAISDEIHQYFVPGRAAEVRDVFIDTFGVFLMTIIRWLIDNKKTDNS